MIKHISEILIEVLNNIKIIKMNSGWISVDDGLPDFDKKVLVFGEQKGMNPQMGGAYISIAKRQDLSKARVNNARTMQDENQFSLMNYVTHWMPLPAPPKKTA